MRGRLGLAEMNVYFSSKSIEFGWLSNFSPHGIALERVRWGSVEHYYQAQKYLDPKVIARIREAETPLKARKAGQDRSLSPRPDWDVLREPVMRRALLAKFTQHASLRARLLATQDATLIHLSSSDLWWGQTAEGEGQNKLGLFLMELRASLA